jgi:hypothetical protein
MPVCGFSHDSVEMAKSITSVALAGDVVILLDNLSGAFGNDALDRALTATRWKHRILGKLENTDLPLLTTWYATGNNVSVAADTVRRLLHIRLNVLDEHPEERGGFQHPNLLGWVRQNRPQLLVDAMIILRGYCAAGRPDQKLVPFGSFEGWSDLVRSAVVWIGWPDPCLTRQGIATADSTAEALDQLLAAWKAYDPNNQGLVIGKLLPILYPSEPRPLLSQEAMDMRSALEMLVSCPPGKVPTARQVGNRLKSFRGRVRSGVFLDIDNSVSREFGAKWKLFLVK